MFLSTTIPFKVRRQGVVGVNTNIFWRTKAPAFRLGLRARGLFDLSDYCYGDVAEAKNENPCIEWVEE